MGAKLNTCSQVSQQRFEPSAGQHCNAIAAVQAAAAVVFQPSLQSCRWEAHTGGHQHITGCRGAKEPHCAGECQHACSPELPMRMYSKSLAATRLAISCRCAECIW